MSHYKPYPAYKDSGVEWLGRVPEHWEIVLDANRFELLHPGLQRGDLVGEPFLLRLGHGGLLPVSAVHLNEVTLDARLDLLHSPLQFGAGEVSISVIDGLELASVNGDHSLSEQPQFPAQHYELPTNATDPLRVVLAEVGDGLEVGRQTAQQPHQLQVALCLALQAAARLDPVQVTVDVELEHRPWVIGGASSRGWIDPREAQLAKIELFDEHIDDPDGISLGNEVVQCLGQQGPLRAALSFDESLHGVTSG